MYKSCTFLGLVSGKSVSERKQTKTAIFVQSAKCFIRVQRGTTTYSLSAHGKVNMEQPDDSDKLPSYKIFTHHLEELCACVGVEMDLNNVQTTKENIVATLPVTLELEMHRTKISKFIRKLQKTTSFYIHPMKDLV